MADGGHLRVRPARTLSVRGVTFLSFDVHHVCAIRSTGLVRLQGVEPNPEVVTDHGRRVSLPSCRALGYQRSALAQHGYSRLPEGWQDVTVTALLGAGVDLFGVAADDLLGLAAHVRSGIRLTGPDSGHSGDRDIDFLDGPMRGPCRLVDRMDESLRQGIVVGTLEGNHAVAEHRCHIDLDPDTGAVTATARTTWRPSSAYILPGGRQRESRAYRRMGERLVRALGGQGAVGSGLVGR